jgi:hypothetical protein
MNLVYHCAECGGVRSHAEATEVHRVNGHPVTFTRTRTCRACGKQTEITAPTPPGVVCPKCGCDKVPVYSTRRPWRGAIVRVRACAACGEQFRTTEQVECGTA